jgi:hypothetical protein
VPCPCSDDDNRFVNGWQCFYPLPCLHRRLLSACEYLWLIRFLPK